MLVSSNRRGPSALYIVDKPSRLLRFLWFVLGYARQPGSLFERDRAVECDWCCKRVCVQGK